MNNDKKTTKALNNSPQTDKSDEIHKKDNVLDLNYREREKMRFIVDLIDLKGDLDTGTWYYLFVEQYGPTSLSDFLERLEIVIPGSQTEKLDWFLLLQVQDRIHQLRDNHLFFGCALPPEKSE